MNLTLSLACRPPCHPISPSCWSTSKEALGQPPPGRITCRLWKKSNLLLFILRQFVVDLLRHPLPARVGQIGPDELFLRETENAKAAAAPQGVVKLVPRIRYNSCPLEDPRRKMPKIDTLDTLGDAIRYAQDTPKICPRYAQDICPRYAPDMPKICPKYAQNMPKICPKYAQYMLMICPSYAWDISMIYPRYAHDLTTSVCDWVTFQHGSKRC